MGGKQAAAGCGAGAASIAVGWGLLGDWAGKIIKVLVYTDALCTSIHVMYDHHKTGSRLADVQGVRDHRLTGSWNGSKEAVSYAGRQERGTKGTGSWRQNEPEK